MSINPNDLVPSRRNPLVAWVARKIFEYQPDKGPQPSQQDSTLTGTTAYGIQSIFDKYFLTDVERLVIYKDVQEMDDSSEECSIALDTIADNVCSSEDGVQTTVEVTTEDAGAQKEIDAMFTRIDMQKKLYPIVRNTIKYGDSFNELVVNGEGELVAVKPLPANTFYRNEDRFGNMVLGQPKYNSDGTCSNGKEDCAFSQIDAQTQRVVAAFFPWQIGHIRHNWDGMSPYGRSMMKVTRVIWRKLKAEEEALIIGRLTRAYLKLVYYVDTTGLAKNQKILALTEFRQSMTQRQDLDGRREQQFSVMSDIYLSDANIKMGNQVVPSRTRVDTIDPKNEGMQNISDMEYFQKKMISTVRVPPAHMGYEKDINAKATLTLQDIQYVRFLRRIQSEVGHFIQQMVDTQLILKGFDPKVIEYEIKWPRLSATDEAIASLAEMQRAQGDQVYLQEGVLDVEFVQRSRFGFDDADIERINKAVEEKEQKELDQQTQLADADAQRQMTIKTAQVRAAGKNNGGDTTKGNPPSGGRSTSNGDGKKGVNPPSRGAMRQEVVEFMEHFVPAMEAYQADQALTQQNGNGRHHDAEHDVLMEAARTAASSPIPTPVAAQSQPAPQPVHVHFEAGMVEAAAPANVIVNPEVKAPDVHITVPPASVTVEGDSIEIHPAAVDLKPPIVHVDVHPEVKGPDITVQPAPVHIAKEEPRGDVEVVQETDASGNKVYKARRNKKK